MVPNNNLGSQGTSIMLQIQKTTSKNSYPFLHTQLNWPQKKKKKKGGVGKTIKISVKQNNLDYFLSTIHIKFNMNRSPRNPHGAFQRKNHQNILIDNLKVFLF